MALSWSEIKSRASAFSKEWQDAANEDSHAKPFLIGFFEVFGVTNKRVATFECAVREHGGKDGYVDLFWPGIKERDLLSYVLVCDFQCFSLHDLSTQSVVEFALKDLYPNLKSFGFLAGYQTQVIKGTRLYQHQSCRAHGQAA